MTDHTREALIEIIGGEGVWPDRVPFVADAILASDWLAAHVAKAAAEHDPAAWMQVALNERAALRRVEIERDAARAENERLTRSRDNVLEAAERDRAEMRAEVKRLRDADEALLVDYAAEMGRRINSDLTLRALAALASQHEDYCCSKGCTGPGNCLSRGEHEFCTEACNCQSAPYLAILADSAGAIAKHEQEVRAQALREAIAHIETHNGTPITGENLRYAATHEALARSWIFDVLTGLADALTEGQA